MSLVYSEEQRLLADTASEFLAARSPVSAQRRLRDEGSAEGFDPALWQEMVSLGWSAIPFPESLGGLDFGCKGLGAVFEQIGSRLSATPLLSSIVLGGSVLELAGTAAQQAEWLPALIAGERRVALALDEQPRHDPAGTALTARREGEGLGAHGRQGLRGGRPRRRRLRGAGPHRRPARRHGRAEPLPGARDGGRPAGLADEAGGCPQPCEGAARWCEAGAVRAAGAPRARPGLLSTPPSTAAACAWPPSCWAPPRRSSRPPSNT